MVREAEAFIEQFVHEMKETFEQNLKSITLCGSYVRGDNTEDSDMDVYCLFECLTAEDLFAVGGIIQKLPSLYAKFELNTQCLTVDEYLHQGFARAFVSPISYFESRVIYGEDFRIRPSREDFISFFESVISETIMSIRHYMTSLESMESLMDGRLKRWVLKPLCVALRAERYIMTGNYPRNYTELLGQSAGLSQTKAIEWILDKTQLHRDIAESPQNVLATLLNISTEVSRRVADVGKQMEDM
ncbi:nucleotidyltransferase domain-containing protein [Alicyclobacillus fodiniaquatilis]|uniref:Nucleotidyltransferase domain-containing protein n=1 Tax=Alicyclobacillus fodiniaquatilis TaxID=1661150 RepID=A0ABW4JG01_9BACL